MPRAERMVRVKAASRAPTNYGASDSPSIIQTVPAGTLGSQHRWEEFSYSTAGLIDGS